LNQVNEWYNKTTLFTGKHTARDHGYMVNVWSQTKTETFITELECCIDPIPCMASRSQDRQRTYDSKLSSGGGERSDFVGLKF